MRSWLTAKFYDALMRRAERRCLSAWRPELLRGLAGDVMEIGAGTGINLAHYPSGLSRLILAEPDANMRNVLRRRIVRSGSFFAGVLGARAEALPLPDASLDTVVSTLALCSVGNLERSLVEILRVLRPGGRFVFLEHVAEPDGSPRLRWQRSIAPVWSLLAGDCHLTRDTEAAIAAAGFRIDTIVRGRLTGAASLIGPVIRGLGTKPGGKRA